jgi:hypothetical protein
VPLLIVLLVLFLLLLTALAFASVRLFAARDVHGNVTAPGCLNGCALALLLGVCGLLGAAAFAAGVIGISTAESVHIATRDLPEISIGAWRDRSDRSEHIVHREGYPLHVVLEWKGHSEPTEALLREIEKLGASDDMLVEVQYLVDENGERTTLVDLALRMSEDDADELEEELRRHRSDLDLSQGVEVILRRAPAASPEPVDELYEEVPEEQDELR